MTDAHADELLTRGGWRLGDAQDRHRAHPDTFLLPDAAELDAIAPGSLVRLLFDVADQADEGRDGLAPYDVSGRPQVVLITERMWAFVERVEGERIDAFLESMPTGSHTHLEPGCRLTVTRADVIDTRPADAEAMAACVATFTELGWPPRDEPALREPVDPLRIRVPTDDQRTVCERAEVLPHPPYFMTGATVEAGLAQDGWPLYGMRMAPSAEHNQCGWFVWTGDPDMSAHQWELTPVGNVRKLRPDAERYLALPPGWGFVVGPDGTEDVFYDADAVT